jgi:hypothetical protein
MAVDFKNIQKKRNSEINKRLKAVSSRSIKKYLMLQGVFPESQFLPSDYFSSKTLVDNISDFSLLKNKYTKLDGSFDDKGIGANARPVTFSFPKSKYTFRSLSVPPIENYLLTIDFISLHWDEIRKLLLLDQAKTSIIPYSYPLFYDDSKREKIAITNHGIMNDVDFKSLAHNYESIVFTDIKNFYASIYTHAIAWAIDPTTHTNYRVSLWANQFDLMVRRNNQNRTKGILTGPHASDIVSEIILSRVDKMVSDKAKTKGIDFAGLRYRDDYILMVKSSADAPKLLTILQQVLEEFHLEVNEDKTSIASDPYESDHKVWKIQTDALRHEIKDIKKVSKSKDCIVIENRRLSLILRQTVKLFREYQDKYIINTILGELTDSELPIRVRSQTFEVKPHAKTKSADYITIFNIIESLCSQLPSTWPYASVFMGLCLESLVEAADKQAVNDIKNYIFKLIELNLEKDNEFALIWLMYLVKRYKFALPKTLRDKYKIAYGNDWLMTSLIDLRKGRIEVFGKKYNFVKNTPEKKIGTLIKIFY